MNLRINPNLSGYVIISIFIIIIMSAMWNFSANYFEKRSLLHETHFNTAKWLSENLKEDQMALIPSNHVFWSLDASLINHTQNYKEVWELSGIILQANTTEAEIKQAQNHLREYINDNPEIKYLVIDWVDKYGTKYFSPRNCEVFDQSWLEVERFVYIFPTKNGTWPGGTIICERR